MPKANAQNGPRSTATTRARLLRAAIAAAATHGWGAVSTRKVADLAGVNQAQVHYHFSSLQDLLREAALAAADETLGPATRHIRDQVDPITGLLDAIDALAAADPQTHEARMVLEATLQASRDDALGAPYRAMLLDLRGLIADRVRRALHRHRWCW